jgi:hypothetical protein
VSPEKNSIVIEHTEVQPPAHFADFELSRPEVGPWTAVGHGSAVSVMQDAEVDVRHTRTIKPYARPGTPNWEKRQTSYLVIQHSETYIHIRPNGTGGLNIVVAGHNLARE